MGMEPPDSQQRLYDKHFQRTGLNLSLPAVTNTMPNPGFSPPSACKSPFVGAPSPILNSLHLQNILNMSSAQTPLIPMQPSANSSHGNMQLPQ